MDRTLSPPGFNLRTDPESSVALDALRPRHGTAAADSQGPARPASRIPHRFRIPITSASPRQASGPSLQHDPLLQLRNHGQRLTIELQELLDAQSFALMNGSRTGDGSSILLSGSPSRHRKSRPTLNHARTGIMKAMEELAALKLQETTLYNELLAERKELLSVVDSTTTKADRFRHELEMLGLSERVTQTQILEAEATSIVVEMEVLRAKLAELESRHGQIQETLAQKNSTIDAQAAPYRSSLDSVTKVLSTFLKTHSQPSPEAARKTWRTEVENYGAKMEAAEKEREALDDGMELWNEVMDAVCGFEQLLRDTLHGAGSKTHGESGLVIRSHLQRVTKELEDMAARAETEGWNLLVVAIGTELQAFKEAGEVLERSLAQSHHETSRRSPTPSHSEPEADLLSSAPSALDHTRDYSPLDD